LTWPDGSKYVGSHKNNTRHGQGIMCDEENGSKYVGSFEDDKYHGQGTLKGPGKETLIGECC